MSKVAKATISIMAVTILSRILGFFREVVLASFYGTGFYADVFVLTLNIPGIIIAMVGAAVATTYIPRYYDIKEEKGEDGALKYTNNILNISSIIAIFIGILGIAFTGVFVKIFGMGFEGEKFQAAVLFTKILMPGVFFLILNKLFTSYLQVHDDFVIASSVGIPYNIIITTFIILSSFNKPYLMAVGTLFAMIVQAVILIPAIKRRKFKYSSYINFNDEDIKKTMKLVLPMLLGISVSQLNIFVDKSLASTLGNGRLSALNYASRFNDFIMALFVTSLITVIYPKMSQLNQDKNESGLMDIIVKSANVMTLIVLPISIGTIVLAHPLIRVMFERGSFNSQSTHLTATALQLYSIGVFAAAVKEVLIRAFYSLSDTKTPMTNASISLILNIILNLIFIKPLGYKGLALSTSISSFVTLILMFISLRKKDIDFDGNGIIKTSVKSLISSLVMAVVTYYSYKLLYSILGGSFEGEIKCILGSVTVSILIYAFMIVILKVDEIKILFNFIKSLRRVKQNKL